ncbi:MAG: hypothetical protein DI537_08625 [Stutzerimonas stutzeri]|nr:MAG: hypothetical protein DI537_08625 [Stutzerimonas stutzeri]
MVEQAAQARIDRARGTLRTALVEMAKAGAVSHASARHPVAPGDVRPVDTRELRVMPKTELRFEDEVLGHLACLETLLMTLTAQIAKHVHANGGDGVRFTAALFDEAEKNLLDGAAQVVGTPNERMAEAAWIKYQALSREMLAHVHRYATPMGSS